MRAGVKEVVEESDVELWCVPSATVGVSSLLTQDYSLVYALPSGQLPRRHITTR
jgi:hypothetical protein